MAYTKKTWVTGETIEASELNHMEDGIETAQQTADTANARDTLGEMSDVALSTPTNGQVLTYDSASTKWKNADASGASTLNEMTDVTLSSPTNGQALVYDSASSKWTNQSVGDDGFVINFTYYDSTLTPDKTMAELHAAVYAGKKITGTLIDGSGTKWELSVCYSKVGANKNGYCYLASPLLRNGDGKGQFMSIYSDKYWNTETWTVNKIVSDGNFTIAT